jgi:hypothetical protein
MCQRQATGSVCYAYGAVLALLTYHNELHTAKGERERSLKGLVPRLRV